MNEKNTMQKITFYISEFRNFRNDGYVQLHYKNMLKDILVAISKSKIFTNEDLSSIFQKEVRDSEEEFLNLK